MEQTIAVGVGYNFALVDSEKTSNIDLTQTGVCVKVDGIEYPLYKATTYRNQEKQMSCLTGMGNIQSMIAG